MLHCLEVMGGNPTQLARAEREFSFLYQNSILDELEQTLEYYLQPPEELTKKRELARYSILRLHDNERLGR
ncbi:MAG: hypothetical protein U0350_25300 [Caldilineaceae bacterium]